MRNYEQTERHYCTMKRLKLLAHEIEPLKSGRSKEMHLSVLSKSSDTQIWVRCSHLALPRIIIYHPMNETWEPASFHNGYWLHLWDEGKKKTPSGSKSPHRKAGWLDWRSPLTSLTGTDGELPGCRQKRQMLTNEELDNWAGCDFPECCWLILSNFWGDGNITTLLSCDCSTTQRQ